MSVSLEEMCLMVNVSYEEASQLRQVVDTDTDSDSTDGESDGEEEQEVGRDDPSSEREEEETALESVEREEFEVDSGK